MFSKRRVKSIFLLRVIMLKESYKIIDNIVNIYNFIAPGPELPERPSYLLICLKPAGSKQMTICSI